MLSKSDFQMLRQMFGEMLRENNDIFGRELKRDMRDEIHSCIAASEARMIKRMDSMKEEIVDGIADILDNTIYPRLYILEQDMSQVKHQLKLA